MRIIKVMSYQIIKPKEVTWKELSELFYDLQYDTWNILNKTIQLCWEYENFSSDYKKKWDCTLILRKY